MKKIIFAILFLIPFLTLADDQKLSLKIEGMTCPSCASAVESRLKRIDGVVSVDISLRKNEVVVRTEEGKTIEDEKFEKAIQEVGFKLISVLAE